MQALAAFCAVTFLTGSALGQNKVFTPSKVDFDSHYHFKPEDKATDLAKVTVPQNSAQVAAIKALKDKKKTPAEQVTEEKQIVREQGTRFPDPYHRTLRNGLSF